MHMIYKKLLQVNMRIIVFKNEERK
jgi:hypothetical protein